MRSVQVPTGAFLPRGTRLPLGRGRERNGLALQAAWDDSTRGAAAAPVEASGPAAAAARIRAFRPAGGSTAGRHGEDGQHAAQLGHLRVWVCARQVRLHGDFVHGVERPGERRG